jgi:hypothetical protein
VRTQRALAAIDGVPRQFLGQLDHCGIAFHVALAAAALAPSCGPRALHLSVDGSAGLKGMDDVPRPKGFEDMPAPALKVLLCVGKQEHENQSREDTSGYDVPYHWLPLHGGQRTLPLQAIAIDARPGVRSARYRASNRCEPGSNEPDGDRQLSQRGQNFPLLNVRGPPRTREPRSTLRQTQHSDDAARRRCLSCAHLIFPRKVI